jgi:hypothetical protein
MKVFIRNTKTGWFYQEPSQWMPNQGAASDLEQVARAIERIFEDHLENVEILLSYDEPRYDLVLPVPPSPSRSDSTRWRQPGKESRHGEGCRQSVPPKKGAPL